MSSYKLPANVWQSSVGVDPASSACYIIFVLDVTLETEDRWERAVQHTNRSLSDFGRTSAVYDRLKSMVINHQLGTAGHLQVNQLARQLNVSITPVRESLSRLCGESLIASTSNRGFFVKPLDVTEISSLYGVAFLLLQHSVACGNSNDIGRVFGVDQSFVIFSRREEVVEGTTVAHVIEAESIYRKIAVLSNNVEVQRIIENFIERTRFCRVVSAEHEQQRVAFERYISELLSALRLGR